MAGEEAFALMAYVLIFTIGLVAGTNLGLLIGLVIDGRGGD